MRRWIISNACFTKLVARAFLPAFLPGRMKPFMKRSTMLTRALRKRWCSWRPMLWGSVMGVKFMYRFNPGSLTSMPSKVHFWKSRMSGFLLMAVTLRVFVCVRRRVLLGLRR